MDKMKVLSYSIGILLVLIGVSSVISGAGLMLYPNGGMGLSVGLLKNSPFSDYFIPGLFLCAVNGLCSLLVAYLAFRHHRFAGVGALLLGAMMIMWIVFQVNWIGWSSWLQPTMLATGVIEMGLGVYFNEIHPENNDYRSHHHHGSHVH